MRIVLVAGIVLALGAVAWLLSANHTMPAPIAPPVLAPSPPTEPGPLDPVQVARTDEAAARSMVTADAPNEVAGDRDTTGTLAVTVVFANGDAAAGIHVFVARQVRGAHRALATMITDADGRARAAIRAGPVFVTNDRGGHKEADLRAGETTELHFELAAGVDVRGTVRLANGQPVAGAEVHAVAAGLPWQSVNRIARSDANGEFTARAVAKTASLGATAAGFAPSPLVDLELSDAQQAPLRVELVLSAPGGALTGRVVDGAGNGIAAATVAAGDSRRLFDHRNNGTTAEKWGPRTVRTGDDGAFLLAGLSPGKLPVEVQSAAYPLWRGECTIEAGETIELVVTMLPGVTVHGVVRGEDGNPLAGAIVRAFPRAIETHFLQSGQYDFDSIFGYAFTVTDDSGGYRLRNAEPGQLHLFAGAGMRRGRGESLPWADVVLPGKPGETLEWSPRIEAGPTIRGVVRHRDGVPMHGVFVSAIVPGQKERQSISTDKDGRFRFVRLRQQAYDVTVQLWSPPKGTPPVEAREVWPDRGELALTASFDAPKRQAPGSVRGTVLDAGNRLVNASALAVILANDDNSWNTNAKVEGGAFRFDGVEPGRKRVVVMSGEDPILHGPWFDLQAAENEDLGTLVTEPPGRLVLKVKREPGTEAIEPEFYAVLSGSAHGQRRKLGRADELVFDNLSAGEFRLYTWAALLARIDTRCTVVAGRTTTVNLTLRAAVARELVVEYGPEQRITTIRLTDASGADVFTYERPQQLARPWRQKLQLPVGTFTLRVETESGGAAATTFTMTSLAEGQAPVVLQAK